MNLEFIESITFEKEFKKLGLSDDDFLQLQIELMRNPDVGIQYRNSTR